jgi:glycosyltransferase involved in cell wall biosynthesis
VGRRARPAVVLAQTHVAGAAAFFCARALRVPSAVKLFGVMGFARRDEPRLRDLRRHAEMIAALRFPHAAWIVLDDGTRGDEALRSRGVPADRIHRLPNGVDLGWQDRAADPRWLRARVGATDDAVIILYLARLVDWKRPAAFVEAAARVRGMLPGKAVFVMAGEGPERGACEHRSRELGADVRFAGAIPHVHVPDALAATGVFVATAEHSNRSIAVCEALLCGVPVVAFDTGETRAVVRDGETGACVPDGDVDALAAAIVSLLGDDNARRRLGAGARAFARDHFTGWERRVEMEREILERLV